MCSIEHIHNNKLFLISSCDRCHFMIKWQFWNLTHLTWPWPSLQLTLTCRWLNLTVIVKWLSPMNSNWKIGNKTYGPVVLRTLTKFVTCPLCPEAAAVSSYIENESHVFVQPCNCTWASARAHTARLVKNMWLVALKYIQLYCNKIHRYFL